MPFPDGPTEAQGRGWSLIAQGVETRSHAVARDKRGAHLALSLERLEALCDRHPVRIGLSATQRPIEVVGRLLVGTRPLPAVVDVGHRRDMDLALELPEGELEAVAVPAPQSDVDRHDLAEAVAEQLLNRWGVLFRNLALHDSLRLP